MLKASPRDPDWRVGEDLPLLNQTMPDLLDVEVLRPLSRAVHHEVVEVALLEHLDREIRIADHDGVNLVEVVETVVPLVGAGPIVATAAQRQPLPFMDVRGIETIGAAARQRCEVEP